MVSATTRVSGEEVRIVGTASRLTVRHVEIEQEDAGPVPLHGAKGGGHARRLLHDFERGIARQDHAHARTHNSVIVGDHHGHRCTRCFIHASKLDAGDAEHKTTHALAFCGFPEAVLRVLLWRSGTAADRL